jgi:hypothetical protein
MSKTDSHANRLPRLVDLVPSGLETVRQYAGEWAAAAAGVPGDPHAVRVVSWKQGWGAVCVARGESAARSRGSGGAQRASGFGPAGEYPVRPKAS